MAAQLSAGELGVAVSRHILIILMVLALSWRCGPPNTHPAQQARDPRVKVESSEPKALRPFKRLILKDGSYEAVSKHEVKGKLVCTSALNGTSGRKSILARGPAATENTRKRVLGKSKSPIGGKTTMLPDWMRLLPATLFSPFLRSSSLQ